MTSAIRFEGVSKVFKGGEETYRALRDDLTWLLTLGHRGGSGATVTALKDVDIDIPVGQATALIGNNGAGKTTALKIATRITYPTAGKVSVRGRVGALIEVGTGLHPELTGRENVKLYGRILGHTGNEIRSRFDEIVEFAGIPEAIDQPVKQYSSGMQLRLGFAIAAHLEPDILIVDEAISVGDAPFQYRCVERMSKLLGEGRTLILVSHNLPSVESLCERAILLDHGRVVRDGDCKEVIHTYLRQVHASLVQESAETVIHGQGMEITEVSLHDGRGGRVSSVRPGDSLTVRVHYRTQRPIEKPLIQVGLGDPGLGVLTMASMLIDGHDAGRLDGEGWIECTFTDLPFKPRTYDVFGSILDQQGLGKVVKWQRWARFQVDEEVLGRNGKNAVSKSLMAAPVVVPYRWNLPNGQLRGGRLDDLVAVELELER